MNKIKYKMRTKTIEDKREISKKAKFPIKPLYTKGEKIEQKLHKRPLALVLLLLVLILS